MGALLKGVLGQLAGALMNPSNAGSDNETLRVGIINMQVVFTDVVRALLWILAQAKGGMLYSQRLCKQVGADLIQAQADNENTIDHVVFTILPNSLEYLLGYVWAHGIGPLRRQVKSLQSSVRMLLGWRGQIISWRKHTVDPELHKLQAWQTYFDRHDRAGLNTLIGWLKHPDRFVGWAAPKLARQIVVELLKPEHKPILDKLSVALTEHWRDDPGEIERALEEWLVAK